MLLTVVLAGALTLAGCGAAPWVRAGSASPTPTATKTAQPEVHSDLAKGSLKRQLTAGGATLDVTYWSTLKPTQWTAAVDKPLFVSFVATAGSTVYASNVVMTANAYRGSKQVSTKPISITDNATVQPGYTVSSPYSYTGLFTLPAVPSTATSVRVSFTYVLLQAVEPNGGLAKSTTADTLTIAIAP